MVEFGIGTRCLVPLDRLVDYAGALWRELRPGAVVWLSGDLGSGKTAFAQAVAAVAEAEPARSPTFALVHEYPGPAGILIHVDCYRLQDPREAIDLDFPELQRRARVVLVEWPERGGRHVPPPDAHVSFDHADEPGRRWLERVA